VPEYYEQVCRRWQTSGLTFSDVPGRMPKPIYAINPAQVWGSCELLKKVCPLP
jgi:hypothetical protein